VLRCWTINLLDFYQRLHTYFDNQIGGLTHGIVLLVFIAVAFVVLSRHKAKLSRILKE